ncbi:MAG: hypothetical protein ACSLFQ_10110 [Thermoanaerobaculia bacterium]
MFIKVTSRTHYQMQGAPKSRVYDVNEVVDASDADAANLTAMGVAQAANRDEVEFAKDAVKEGRRPIAGAVDPLNLTPIKPAKSASW